MIKKILYLVLALLMPSYVYAAASTGTAILTASGANKLISNTRSYYHLANGSVSEASLLEGRHLLGDMSNSIANTFLNQMNWLRMFNISTLPLNLNVEAYDRDGNLIGSRLLTLAAEHGIDLEAESKLSVKI